MDIKIAFLYSEIEEDIQIKLPTGYSITRMAKLKKALYGLKQAPRVWYNTLTTFLLLIRFQPLNTNSFVFYYNGVIITIYVNNLLIISASKPDINKIKDSLKQRFKMSNLGACHFYLRIEVIRDRPRRTLRLSQTAYLHKILQDFSMEHYNNKITTPIKTSSRLMPAKPGYKADLKF